MNIFNKIRNDLEQIIISMPLSDGFELSSEDIASISLDTPASVEFGDVTTNAAMVLAKKIKRNPRDFAQQICNLLIEFPFIIKAEVAGPGFINMSLTPQIWNEQLIDIINEGSNYGSSNIGNNNKINVEYVSANPTGPMHIGHARGAVFGDALSCLLSKVGYDVTKEYYVNDAGSQIDTLAKSCLLRYKEALGYKIDGIPEGLYPGNYLIDVGTSLKEKYKDKLLSLSEEQSLAEIRSFAVKKMLDLIKKDLSNLGIHHDIFTSELEIQNRNLVEKALAVLNDQNLIYNGVIEAPKGKKSDDWEKREQTLFKSTDFGDDSDRAMKKSDGSWTYFSSDCAYHLDKISRGFNEMIIVLGADHGGYIKRLKAIVSALSNKKASIDVKISQLVNFVENGQPIKMSKRAGTFTTVNDVVKEVGKDVVRFIMLTRKNDITLDFDLNLVKEQSKDNPIFYIQYAHARARSVLRIAQEQMPEAIALKNSLDLKILENLTSQEELLLIKKMAYWPKLVESAAIAREPHRIAFYLQELAACFHSLWNKGKENELMRFLLADDIKTSAARLVMLTALTNVIASALSIFNIEAVEEMR